MQKYVKIALIIFLLIVIVVSIQTISKKSTEKTQKPAGVQNLTADDTVGNDVFAGEDFAKEMAAPELRLQLNFLLRENIGMTMKTARGAYSELPSREASRAIANQNNDRISGLIGSIYGDEIGAEINQIYQTRTEGFENYATSLKEANGTDGRVAKERLVNTARDLRLLLVKINPQIDDVTLGALLADDTRLLQIAIDTYSGGDFGNSYAREGDAYENMSAIAELISDAVSVQFPQRYPGDPTGQTVQLESSLNARLREDVNMHVDLMRHVFNGSQAQEASRAYIAQNNQDIADIIASVYGQVTGALFLNLWSTRTELFEQYANAVTTGNEELIATANTEIGQYALLAAKFFASENSLLPQETLESLILEDTTHMREALDAYAIGNFTQSFESEHSAYEHIGELGRTLTRNMIIEFPEAVEEAVSSLSTQ